MAPMIINMIAAMPMPIARMKGRISQMVRMQAKMAMLTVILM
jgi:hypothetical protein